METELTLESKIKKSVKYIRKQFGAPEKASSKAFKKAEQEHGPAGGLDPKGKEGDALLSPIMRK